MTVGTLPFPNALVLVAVIPEVRDLEIARLLGWYRIPLRKAPKVIDVDILAFYQTGVFGKEQRWQVATFADVRGYELVTRRELFKDEPDHPRANEEYYKVSIGPLQSLPRPIMAGNWRRVTFLYSMGGLFKDAKTIKDLVVRADERQVLWHQLRERALLKGKYKAEDLPEFDLDPSILLLLQGLKG